MSLCHVYNYRTAVKSDSSGSKNSCRQMLNGQSQYYTCYRMSVLAIVVDTAYVYVSHSLWVPASQISVLLPCVSWWLAGRPCLMMSVWLK